MIDYSIEKWYQIKCHGYDDDHYNACLRTRVAHSVRNNTKVQSRTFSHSYCSKSVVTKEYS